MYNVEIEKEECYALDCDNSYASDDISVNTVSTLSTIATASIFAAMAVPVGGKVGAALGYVKGKMLDEGTEGHIDGQALEFSYHTGAIAAGVGATTGVLVDKGVKSLGSYALGKAQDAYSNTKEKAEDFSDNVAEKWDNLWSWTK